MKGTLVLATSSAGKIAELRAVLGANYTLTTLADYPSFTPGPEDANTFHENAIIKATDLARASGHWALADDSGLSVDALGGRPGVHSARYGANDQDRIARLLRELAAVPPQERKAHFTCALCLAMPGGAVRTVLEERCDGQIALSPRGANGHGYDPIFIPEPETRTFAELTLEEKGRYSHRGRALRRLVEYLANVDLRSDTQTHSYPDSNSNTDTLAS